VYIPKIIGSPLRPIQAASLAVGLGQGLALARGRLTKHAVKQVDRLLSNRGVDVDALLCRIFDQPAIGIGLEAERQVAPQVTATLPLVSLHGADPLADAVAFDFGHGTRLAEKGQMTISHV
jgi:hypothetical protein